ncbi:MAG: glycoside hydrolase family protein [Polaromonas sp.]
MQASKAVSDSIRSLVGFHPEPYSPGEDVPTHIGYGHRITGELEWAAVPCTEAQAEAYLVTDVGIAEATVRQRWTRTRTTKGDQDRFDAACLAVHMLGCDLMLRAWLLKGLTSGKDIGPEAARWAVQLPEKEKVLREVRLMSEGGQ